VQLFEGDKIVFHGEEGTEMQELEFLIEIERREA